MRLLNQRRSQAVVGFAATLSLVASFSVPVSWASPGARPGRTRYAQILEPCPPPAPGHATCFALVRKTVKSPGPGTPADLGVRPYVVGAGAVTAGPSGGLTPEDLANAYGYSPTSSGTGQTVAIVDAFDDPEIESDLAEFDSHYELPACTTANGCFKKVGQTGTSSLPAVDKAGWSVEIALDVETVHAACPNCRILLVEANNNSNANLAIAVNESVALGATEVSNSYGGPEASEGSTERAAYNHPGVPIVASTGDDGYYGWDWVNEFGPFEGDEMPSAPASLASTVAVGGTTLELNPDGTRANEAVWNNNGPGDEEGLASGEREGATGGGCSKLFTAQPWQQAVAGFSSTGCGTTRADADIAAVGDPFTGLDIYDSFKCGPACEFPRVEGGWVTIGGTSLSAPFISSLYALAGGGDGVGYPSLTLYGHASDSSLRFDVTEGANGFCGGESVTECAQPNEGLGLVDCEGTTACNAALGFDGPSGIGTPEGLGLFKPLLPSAAITTPSGLTAGAAASFGAGGSSDPYSGGSIVGASWSWGDGTSGAGVSATHAYAAVGNYTVALSVTDSYGLTSPPVMATVSVGAAFGGSGTGASTGSAGASSAASTAGGTVGAATGAPTSTIAASSAFSTAHAALSAKTGLVTLTMSVVDPGTLDWSATFPNGKFGAFASASKCKAGQLRLAGKCRPAKVVFAKGSETVGAAGSVTATLKPSASALKALKSALNQKRGIPVSVLLTFQSSLGGPPASHTQTVIIKPKKK
jgi:hypothetical protein